MRLEELVGQVVAAHPDEPALEVGGEVQTYAELWTSAEACRGAVEAYLRPPYRVGLQTTRSAATYAAYLGSLLAGATVVPISSGTPAGRARAIAEAAEVCVVLGEGPRSSSVGNRPSIEVTATGGPQPHGDSPAAASTHVDHGHASMAYIMFTSGSTGRPKGVPISHENALAFIRDSVVRFGLGPGCRMTQAFDLSFDVSVFDLFAAWCSGATLIVPGRLDLMHPVAWVRSAGITHWASVPSVPTAARALGELEAGSMPSLEFSLFIGEPLRLDVAEAWQAAAPDGAIVNFYGPTELTVAASSHQLSQRTDRWRRTPNATAPIGRIHGHLDWKLDRSGREADGAVEGELLVRGVQRFDGYLDPKDNETRFVDDSGNMHDGSRAVQAEDWYRTGDLVRDLGEGELLHLGRIDSQVKVRGYRVELGEIEAAICRVPGIDDAAVVTREGALQQLEIVAFMVGRTRPDPDLRRCLIETLPPYMVPQRMHWLEFLPQTTSGKIDRVALARQATES